MGDKAAVYPDLPVGEAVLRHCGATCTDHRDEDLCERGPSGPAARGEDGRKDREWQREDRVRDTDHFERRPERTRDPGRPAHHGRRGLLVRWSVPVHRNSAPGSSMPRNRATRAHHASRNLAIEGSFT